MTAQTGIAAIGPVEWGTHFCHFYRTANDLAETLVPFFKAGLEGDEACLWVTAEPFHKEQAIAALNTAVDRFDRRQAKGQIAVYDHREWQDRHRSTSDGATGRLWLDAKDAALAQGYRGLRVTGNTAFLEPRDWVDFIDDERAMRQAFHGEELMALCSYDSGRCDAGAVLDIVHAHDFALARRRDKWEIIESAGVKRSKEAFAVLNAELERRIDERTRELADALAHQRLLTAELSHRVKNTIASVQTIVDQTLRTHPLIGDARATVRGRLVALGQVHDRLAAVDWKGVSLREVASAVLGPHRGRVSLELNGETLTPRAALDLALVFHELVTNAAKFGALSTLGGSVQVHVDHDHASELSIEWRESGGPRVRPPAQRGFGTLLIRQIVAHDLRGKCELGFEPAGLRCTIRAPAREVLVTTKACCHGGGH